MPALSAVPLNHREHRKPCGATESVTMIATEHATECDVTK
jgi:hypothetical protein